MGKIKRFIKKNMFLSISFFLLFIILAIIAIIYIPNVYRKFGNLSKTIIDEKEPLKDYYCEDDAEFDSSNNTCSKYEKLEAEQEITCDFGYDLENDKCVATEIEDYNRYYCTEGMLQGTNCVITITYKAQADKYCSEIGYSYYYAGNGNTYCKYSGSSENFVKCPSGYTYSYATETCYPKMPVLYKYYCKNAKRTNSTICEETKTIPAQYIEGCANGFERINDKCYKKSYIEPTYVPKCKAGSKMECDDLNDSSSKCYCSGLHITEAKYNLKCETNYQLVNNKCILYK